MFNPGSGTSLRNLMGILFAEPFVDAGGHELPICPPRRLIEEPP